MTFPFCRIQSAFSKAGHTSFITIKTVSTILNQVYADYSRKTAGKSISERETGFRPNFLW